MLKAAVFCTHIHTLVVFAWLFLISCSSVFADDAELVEQVRYKEEVLRTLKEEISQIDSEMLRCEKAKKGWVAATVIGGVGVAATGTAAIVQTVKMKEKNNPKKPEEQKDGQK